MESLYHAKTLYYEELGRRADEAMRAKVRDGAPSGRIPLGSVPGLKSDLIIDTLKARYVIEASEKVA